MIKSKFLPACVGISITALSLGFLFQSVQQPSAAAAAVRSFNPEMTNTAGAKNMKLGAFSMSLNVKDLNASKTFYENLGFKVLAGDMKKNYLVMKNENALIGLFHGMFKNNILTFNPGWDENGTNTAVFDDVRAVQRELKIKGIKLDTEADEKTTGPAGFFLTDPDGNSILVDQHR